MRKREPRTGRAHRRDGFFLLLLLLLWSAYAVDGGVCVLFPAEHSQLTAHNRTVVDIGRCHRTRTFECCTHFVAAIFIIRIVVCGRATRPNEQTIFRLRSSSGAFLSTTKRKWYLNSNNDHNLNVNMTRTKVSTSGNEDIALIATEPFLLSSPRYHKHISTQRHYYSKWIISIANRCHLKEVFKADGTLSVRNEW